MRNFFTFGTDGIRTRVGNPPLTIEHLILFGHALGQWMKIHYEHPSVALAYDTRNSAHFIKNALQAAMLLEDVTLYDAGVIPTPALYKMAQQKKEIAYCIMISASHNAFYDNGIKITDMIHGKLRTQDEDMLIAYTHQQQPPPSYSVFGTAHSWHTAADEYKKFMCSLFPSNYLQGIKIVLDCAHGATGTVAPAIFAQLGAHTIVINNSPNGTNINHECGSLHPASLQEAVQSNSADIGFAFDGDGDRVIAVNGAGEYKDGDDILYALLSDPLYAHDTHIVGTSMTNQALVNSLKGQKKTCVRVAVGDKHVAHYLSENPGVRLGGEPSGHIIFKEYALMSDGIYTALRLLQVLMRTKNMAMNTVAKYPQITHNIAAQKQPDLRQNPYKAIIEEYTQKVPEGRVLVRYSGTEPVLRVMVEDADAHHAQNICATLATILQSTLQGTL
jgi:phosphoglucosamine mutase